MRFLSVLFIGFCTAGTLANSALAQTTAIDPYGPPDPTQELPLDGDALTALFMDRTHRGYYEYEDWETLDPAFTEEMKADGSTVHNRDGIISAGEWRTRNNVVCFTYNDLNGGCFSIYQRGNCYYALSAFTSDLVAISVIDGETPDCEPSIA
ncbi:hypothetical protein GCM10009069_03640 [Algimonas arctica]|uniref:Uncharacterized protein n=1 Tax=Algimonas arctica TaxID=1479486 RepID=A0A8J3CL61_9PROT|nr:hypothetical protein [Algimonas arctica]GHA83611.1 hypothetical protein GCM10009069_03640 [Algimonas arctica]